MSDRYQDFHQHISKIAESFKSIDKSEVIRVISHLDCDGICACSILINALNKDNRKYSISILQQLNDASLKELEVENYKYYVFTDLGSSVTSSIAEKLKDKTVFVIDHHELDPNPGEHKNLHHINPHLHGIDGGSEISGAGVVYLFTSALDKNNEQMAHIAVVGAIGDIQEDKGFSKLNTEILETAKKQNKIDVKQSIKLYGSRTRPLHKALEYSNNPFIPGISGSESAAIQFLHQIGIDPKQGNDWKKLYQLTDAESKKLASAIILKRIDEENPEDIFGYIYTLTDEEEGSPFKDAKEFSTMLNACGRLNKASLGIGSCLGNTATKKKAVQNLADYKKQLVSALNWFRDNPEKDLIKQGDGYIIINAKENVLHTIIGTLASILSKSKQFEDNTYIMALARSIEGKTTKVSLRISGLRDNPNVDLRKVAQDIVDRAGGEAGGHMQAAGALIPTAKEAEFIRTAETMFKRVTIEENISS